MFENIIHFFKNIGKKEKNKETSDTAKERLHLVLMQDRANVSADFLELMKQEIIEVIKKYIDIDEKAIDVRLTNKSNEDGTMGAPALYANIPIVNIKKEKENIKQVKNTENNDNVNESKNKEENESINSKNDEMENENDTIKDESNKENNQLNEEKTNNETIQQKTETNDNTVNIENANA